MGDEYNDGYGLEDWEIPFTDLEFGQLVGKGNFGCVWAGEYVGTPVAIKKVEQQGVDKLPAEYILDSETALKYFRRELTVLKSIHHPNVVQFMGTAVSGDSVYIVTEWVGGGDLRKLIKKKQIPVTWKERTEIARETAIAMAYLHVKKLIHRDLKPANLLLTEHGRVKVCDLGLARTIESTEKGEGKKYYTIAGTDVWMAPEVIMGDSYDFKCDVFSFGCILYNLIKRHSPPRRKPANAFQFEEEVMMADVPKGCPPVLIQMMKECLEYEPEKRPNFRELAARLKVLVNELPDHDEEEEQKTIEIDGVEVEIESLLKVSKEQQEKEKQQQQGIPGGSVAIPPPLSQSKVLPGSSITPPPSSSQLPPWPEEEERQPQQQPQQQQPQQQPQQSSVGNGSVPVVKQSKIAPPPGGSVVKPAASVPQAESEGEKEFLEEDVGDVMTSSDLEGRNTRFAVLFKALREKEGKGGRKKLQLEDTALGPETNKKPAGTPQNEVRRNKRFAALLAMVKPEDN